MRSRIAVEVSDLTVRRGRVLVFDSLSVTIPSGCATGLLGPSGCGKTTLMRSIVGLQRVASGVWRTGGFPETPIGFPAELKKQRCMKT